MASSAPAPSELPSDLSPIDIKPLLLRLWPQPTPSASPPDVSPEEISIAISHFFTNRISPIQAASLLMCLHFTQLDRSPQVLSLCAAAMRQAAAQVPSSQLQQLLLSHPSSADKASSSGSYAGGFCDIVGTGGDSHNTFNISTTASILCSSLLRIAKHGNRASTSTSGSADLIASMTPRAPNMAAVTPANMEAIYSATNYAFLFAPVFHPGMKHVAPIRKQLPWRTIFNLLGPLANPMDVGTTPLIEARVIGVARTDLGPIFAEALRLAGVKKALIVCGEEELDEISCAGWTNCWMLRPEQDAKNDVAVEHFKLQASDFGLSAHPLSTVSGGMKAAENATILRQILQGGMADDEPLMEFVLMNAAALFVISGICDADTSSMGPDDDGKVILERGPGGGRWKEGVRRARWAIKSGEAWEQWTSFVDITNKLGE